MITGVECRRRRRVEERYRIVAETVPGACFVQVARRDEVYRSLLWSWLRFRVGACPLPELMPGGQNH
jgi:transposase